ncbi:hypothetical protein C8Q72DRAFT_942120 [Fomitopsis betulina]|nr:hypothetical protein C8Q72DRAFT_942120 [Fomitopsis betulina]
MGDILLHSATETVLRDQDILQEIFAHVDEPIDLVRRQYHSSALDSRKALSAAARTCKAFCRPALKLLWRDLPSINALLCALSASVGVIEDPSHPRVPDQQNFNEDFGEDFFGQGHKDLWACHVSLLLVSEMLMPGHTQGVIGSITNAERERFAIYTSFIRTIDLRTKSKTSVHADVYRHLAQLDMPLAPHLHTICCHHEWSRDVEAILRLSGPALRTLVLSDCYVLPEARAHFEATLDGICAAAPNVQKIIIHGGGGIPAQFLLCGMKHLRSLDLAGSLASILHAMDSIDTLATLDCLEELSLRGDYDQPRYRRGPLLPRPGFASLRKLTVRGGLRSIPDLFSGLPDLQLKELHVEDLKYEHLSNFEDLVQGFRPLLRNSLETLSISYGILCYIVEIGIAMVAGPPEPLIPIISPLFSLPNIKRFSLTSYKYSWVVDDSGLSAVAHAWPDLVSLRLSCRSVGGDPVAPSIHGIAELANRCTGLRTIRLSALEMLRAVRTVEAPYGATANRFAPSGVELPEDNAIDNIETGRLVDIVWPLFGVIYPEEEDMFSEKWNTVLREVAQVQNGKDLLVRRMVAAAEASLW